MPLVPCKCTNCGANLQVDNTKDAAICEFCGSAFIVEKAINNYNVTNHISAGVVNVYGSNSSDFEIRGGVLEKYNGSAADVVIPNTVTHIRGYGDRYHGSPYRHGAFGGCIGLKSVKIPTSVTEIGLLAFSGCTGLTSVMIPSSVTKIGDAAFSGCTGLTSVTIPNSVKEIGFAAFSGCTSLKSITIPNSVTIIDQHVFSECSDLTNITIPNSVTKIDRNAFKGCSGLTNITIPNNVTEIEGYAFNGCSGLTQITIPPSVTKLGYLAFDSCPNLKRVSLPDTIQKIGGFDDGSDHYMDLKYSIHKKDVTRFKNSTRWNLHARYLLIGIFNVFGEDNDNIKDTLFAWNDRNLNLGIYEDPKRGWCYIATAVYGSYDCPPVWTLRRYRDHILAATRRGRAFIRIYYAVSPSLVKWFGKTAWFQCFWRSYLDKLVARLQDHGVKDTPYQDKDS